MINKSRSLNSGFAVAILSVSLFLIYVTANAPTPLYMLWQQHIHYSATGISIIFVTYHLGIALALLTLGRVQDTRTTKRLLMLALFGAMVAAGLFSTAQHFWQLICARAIIGLSSGTFVSCGTALIIQIGLNRNIYNTPLLVTISCVLGFGLGPFYAGVLADLLHNPGYWIFLPAMAALLICLVLLGSLRTEPITIPSAGDGAVKQEQSVPRNYKIAFTAVALFAPPFALSGVFISLGPSMIAELMHNNSRTVAGAIPLLMFGAGTIAQLILNRLPVAKQVGLGVLGAILGGIGILAAEAGHSVLIMGTAAVLAGVSQSMTQLAGTRLIKQYRPMGTLGRSTATFFLGGYLFAACTIFLLGWISTQTNLEVASNIFLCLCLLLLAAGTIGFGLMRRQQP